MSSHLFTKCVSCANVPQVISWLPVATAADAIVEMADLGAPYAIFHLRHPQPIPFSMVIEHFSRLLKLRIVSYAQWMSRLDSALTDSNTQRVRDYASILGLVSFFRSHGMGEMRPTSENGGLSILLGVEDSCKLTPILRRAGTVSIEEKDVHDWVKYWRRVGALPNDEEARLH